MEVSDEGNALNLPASYDLIVIGAGPAGSSAAITAARMGASVLLLERGRYPRHKVCGEFVSAESVELLASLLGDDAAPLFANAPRVRRARLFFGATQATMPIEPPAISLARYDLDAALFRAAKRAGVTAVQQLGADSIHRDHAIFTVSTTAGTFTSRSLIVAAGRWSNVGLRSVDIQPVEKYIGLKAHFRDPGDFAKDTVELHFFDGGYCGIDSVAEGVVSVCAMIRANLASSLQQVFSLSATLAARSSRWQPLFEPVATFPLFFGSPIPERDGVLYAGDAANFVDPFIGDGISLALQTGTLAAEILRPVWRGESDLGVAAAQYRAQYEQRFFPIFRNAARIRRLLGLPYALQGLVANVLRMPLVSRRFVRLTRAV